MPIKFEERKPKPQPLPPSTFALTGMSEQEAKWLKSAIDHAILLVSNSFEAQGFLRRSSSVLAGNPQPRESE